jgi:cobalt transporter subunit CbtA
VAELRHIVGLALLAGLLAGMVTTVAQLLTTVPLVLEAEAYERGAAHADGVAHRHGDTLARSIGTLASNVAAGVGFGLILGALLSNQRSTSLKQGLLLGGGAFVAVTLAPALGLPPELPGTASPALIDRQLWWIGTAVASAIGLALVVLGRGIWPRLAGVVLMTLPHLVGAPRFEGVVQHGPPAALQVRFIAASLATTGLFWLVLGASLGWLFGRRPTGRSSPSVPAGTQ